MDESDEKKLQTEVDEKNDEEKSNQESADADPPQTSNDEPKPENIPETGVVEAEEKPPEEDMQVDNNNEDATVEQSVEGSNILDDAMAVAQEESSENVVSATTDEVQDMEPTVTEEQTVNASKAKAKSGTFSLGVPGLTFSSQNLKVASDGTKMVQIHQSQITPSQLQALQSNPNIKVVFRHIPTGKSFTKPPKNLFSCLSKQQGTKRKISSDHGGDDSIYNFDEEFDKDYTDSNKPRGSISKYARYTPNIGMKKRGPGRPRLIPDPHAITTGLGNKQKPPAIPAQILLTDALTKLNNPNAPHMVKIHVKQVTHDILTNMELNPDYNLVLTAKHDLPPEHSLEELVKEWEEKEVEDSEIKEVQAERIEEPTLASTVEEPVVEEQMTVDKQESDADANEEDEELLAEQQRLKEEQKEREEAELLATAMQERKSRSGRIRKPSRYSLDIARLTKRRNVAGDISPDEDFVVTPPKPVILKTPKSDIVTPGKKRGRGRPRKIRPEEEAASTSTPTTSSMDDTEVKEKEQVPVVASPERKKTTEPMVIMSPSDKKLAETIRLKDAPVEKEQSEAESLKTESASEKKETEVSDTEKADKSTPEDGSEKESLKTEDEKMDVSESEDKTTEEKQDSNEKESENDKPCSDAANETVKTEEEDTVEKGKEEAGDKEETKDEEKSEKTDKTENTNAETETEKEEEKKDTDEATATSGEKISKEDNDRPERKISSDGETPSDILARKLDIPQEEMKTDQPTDEKESEQKPHLKDFVEEEGDVDNKYRLRKLLQQCTIDEIRSVAIPRALDAISIGDFYLHKAGQMSSEKVKFASLYKQLEVLHSAIEKESVRYNTLLRRANKVGGDRRMDKVILMPIYNKKAAESIRIIGSSIDAHIGGINQKSTAQMIAANSFRINCKMDAPVHRLKLPDLAEKNQRNKRRQFQHKYSRHPEPDSTTPDQPNQRNFGRLPGSLHSGGWKKSNYPVRKPSYLLGTSTGTAHSTLQEQARMQLVGRYQSQLVVNKDSPPVSASVVDSSTTALVTENTNLASQSSEVTSAATVDLNQELMAQQQVGDVQAAQVVTEDGAAVIAAEEGKQLVAIGDGQYVELPEGYTLIQTDDGYIIGQPGATFVQGEDGNVYMTSTEEGTEATTQVLTTTAPIGETPATDALLDQLGQT